MGSDEIRCGLVQGTADGPQTTLPIGADVTREPTVDWAGESRPIRPYHASNEPLFQYPSQRRQCKIVVTSQLRQSTTCHLGVGYALVSTAALVLTRANGHCALHVA
jgi:hypothetical protein